MARALKSFDRIKPAVKVWWSQFPQPGVLLQSGEITMTPWTRSITPVFEGQPMGVSYDGAALTYEGWVVPTGAPKTGYMIESMVDAMRATMAGIILGTAGYMAPEQARGETEQVSERSDVYSLGALLKFLLEADNSNHAGGAEQNDIRQALTPRNRRILAAIIAKAMSAEMAGRYSSVSDLRADVEHYLDGIPVSAYPESWVSRSWRWVVRNRVWILLVLAYLVMRALLLFLRA